MYCKALVTSDSTSKTTTCRAGLDEATFSYSDMALLVGIQMCAAVQPRWQVQPVSTPDAGGRPIACCMYLISGKVMHNENASSSQLGNSSRLKLVGASFTLLVEVVYGKYCWSLVLSCRVPLLGR